VRPGIRLLLERLQAAAGDHATRALTHAATLPGLDRLPGRMPRQPPSR
jgi:hypothetical protein